MQVFRCCISCIQHLLLCRYGKLLRGHPRALRCQHSAPPRSRGRLVVNLRHPRNATGGGAPAPTLAPTANSSTSQAPRRMPYTPRVPDMRGATAQPFLIYFPIHPRQNEANWWAKNFPRTEKQRTRELEELERLIVKFVRTILNHVIERSHRSGSGVGVWYRCLPMSSHKPAPSFKWPAFFFLLELMNSAAACRPSAHAVRSHEAM